MVSENKRIRMFLQVLDEIKNYETTEEAKQGFKNAKKIIKEAAHIFFIKEITEQNGKHKKTRNPSI